MFFVLVLSATFATSHGPAYDEVLVDHPATLAPSSREVAAEPVCDVSWLHGGEGVIDLVEPPPLMPARAVAPIAPAARAASSVAAVTVEARTRE